MVEFEKAGYPTHLPEVNALLAELLSQARRILGEGFIGLYLYGSLTTGDFVPNRSDIDFVVVTDGEIPAPVINKLEAMHQALWEGDSRWAKKLEGVYIPFQVLRRFDPQSRPCPTVNEGRFFLARQGSDWVFQRHILREHQAIVAGPSLINWIDPVQPDDLCKAAQAILQEWWAPMLQDPSSLTAPGYQAFAVLSMCRALFLLEERRVVSKAEAARWAMGKLDPGWRRLIQRALDWRDGDPAGDIHQTLKLIRHTLRLSQEFK